MTTDSSVPPTRDLPPDRRDVIKQLLMLEANRQRPRTTTRWSPQAMRRRRLVAVTAVSALAVVVGVVGFREGTEVASAAEIRAKVADALSLDETVSGEFLVRTQDPGPRPPGLRASSNAPLRVPPPSSFVVGADGSYLSIVSAPDSAVGRDVAYDAASGIETSVIPIHDAKPFYVRAANVDPALLAQYPQEAQVGAWVLGALGEGDPDVEETTYDSRPAWSLTTTFAPGESAFESYGARVDIVVDQDTGLVLRVTQYAYDTERWSSIASVSNLRFGEEANGAVFIAPKPHGATEIEHDYGFERVSVDSARAILGYTPILPADTLGRSLADFAVARASSFPFAGLPPRRLVASARYGRGADAITVSTYRGSADDLPALLPGVTVQTAQIENGSFAGAQAYVGSTPLGRSGVAAFAEGLVLQISAPSNSEALRIANSLTPQ